MTYCCIAIAKLDADEVQHPTTQQASKPRCSAFRSFLVVERVLVRVVLTEFERMSEQKHS